MQKKRVVFNADDFGLSPRVNRAVIEAHRDGLLTAASLMVAEPFAEDAVALAREHPGLELGLHVVLCQGRSALPHAEVSGLTRPDGTFPDAPVFAGMKLFFGVWLRDQIRREVRAQLARFEALVGRKPGHIDGHLNIHVHPTVLPILIELAREAGIPTIRLPREPAEVTLALDPVDAAATRLNGFIFERLCERAERQLRAAGIAHARRCFGVLRPMRMTERLVLELLERAEPGLTEIYFHPGHPHHGDAPPDHETATLTGAALRERVEALGIALATNDPDFATDVLARAAKTQALAPIAA
jgi:hopanoid biosynthesis associated protein HpnK